MTVSNKVSLKKKKIPQTRHIAIKQRRKGKIERERLFFFCAIQTALL